MWLWVMLGSGRAVVLSSCLRHWLAPFGWHLDAAGGTGEGLLADQSLDLLAISDSS